MDSSYSINTLWAESQLDVMFDIFGTANSSSMNIIAAAEGEEGEDENWLTFAQYCQLHPENTAANNVLKSGDFLLGAGHGGGSNSSGGDGDSDQAASNSSICKIPGTANTRSPLCIAELLFVFHDSDITESGIGPETDTSSQRTTESVVQLHGVLSQGSHYCCCLSGSAKSAVHLCVAQRSDPYIGRQVRYIGAK